MKAGNALEKVVSGVTEKFLEHQKETKARVMLAIDEKQKREMELLEKMRKDDRDHELRLVQIIGQMMFAQPPPTTSLYYPPPAKYPLGPFEIALNLQIHEHHVPSPANQH